MKVRYQGEHVIIERSRSERAAGAAGAGFFYVMWLISMVSMVLSPGKASSPAVAVVGACVFSLFYGGLGTMAAVLACRYRLEIDRESGQYRLTTGLVGRGRVQYGPIQDLRLRVVAKSGTLGSCRLELIRRRQRLPIEIAKYASHEVGVKAVQELAQRTGLVLEPLDVGLRRQLTGGQVTLTVIETLDDSSDPHNAAFREISRLVLRAQSAGCRRSGGITVACFLGVLYYGLTAADRSHPIIVFCGLVGASLYAFVNGQVVSNVSYRKLREAVLLLCEQSDPVYLPAVQSAPDLSFPYGRFQKLTIVAAMLERALESGDYYVPSADRARLLTQLHTLTNGAQNREEARIANVFGRAIATYGDQVDLEQYRKLCVTESGGSIQREIRRQLRSLIPDWEARLAMHTPSNELLRASKPSNTELLIPAVESSYGSGDEHLVRAAEQQDSHLV